MKEMQEKMRAARGEIPCDILFKNGRVINTLSGEIHKADVAVHQGRIIGFGDYEAKEVVNLEGKYLAPGLIDAHIHVESTMLTFPEFARAVLPRGTTAVVVDPHEIANVLGLDGIRYVIDSIKGLPLDIFIMLPSSVPASPFETAGAKLTSDDLVMLIHEDRVAGVGEMMNFPGVYIGQEEELDKIEAAKWKQVDGHAPGLSGKNLNAYILAGIRSDHECTSLEEAKEKLRAGMHILIREGTSERNLEELIQLVTPENSSNFSFAVDDKNPLDLIEEGHIDFCIKKAVKLGLNPVTAIQMATINTARNYDLKNMGAIAPRYWADLIVFENFNDFRIQKVYKKGHLVAKDGEYFFKNQNVQEVSLRSTINIVSLHLKDFQIPAKGNNIRIIEVVPNQIITRGLIDTARTQDGYIISDIDRDIIKAAVVERHQASGNMALGFVKGFGLKKGALASTVAHDAHNIVILGTNDKDMLLAVQTLVKIKGGQVVVKDGKVSEMLPLPIAGLISDLPLEEVRARFYRLNKATKNLGCTIPDPFMTLSFISLTPIPELKLSDQGLVDVNKFEIVDLFVG